MIFASCLVACGCCVFHAVSICNPLQRFCMHSDNSHGGICGLIVHPSIIATSHPASTHILNPSCSRASSRVIIVNIIFVSVPRDTKLYIYNIYRFFPSEKFDIYSYFSLGRNSRINSTFSSLREKKNIRFFPSERKKIIRYFLFPCI